MNEGPRDQEITDTEITLGTGKLLGIFFIVAALCALFFTMGYMLGRGAGARADAVSPAPGGPSNPANKPNAAGKLEKAAADAPGVYDAPPRIVTDQPNAADAAQPASSSPGVSIKASSTDSSSQTGNAQAATTSAAGLKNVAGDGPYMVQVAAVSKKEDAEILVAALRKKQYPVFIVSNTADALFHVQVGPFAGAKEAESMRDKLSSDGYNAMVKK